MSDQTIPYVVTWLNKLFTITWDAVISLGSNTISFSDNSYYCAAYGPSHPTWFNLGSSSSSYSTIDWTLWKNRGWDASTPISTVQAYLAGMIPPTSQSNLADVQTNVIPTTASAQTLGSVSKPWQSLITDEVQLTGALHQIHYPLDSKIEEVGSSSIAQFTLQGPSSATSHTTVIYGANANSPNLSFGHLDGAGQYVETMSHSPTATVIESGKLQVDSLSQASGSGNVSVPNKTGTIAIAEEVVDLVSDQAIIGAKTFSSLYTDILNTVPQVVQIPMIGGFQTQVIPGNSLVLPRRNGTVAVAEEVVDLVSAQNINGVKTFADLQSAHILVNNCDVATSIMPQNQPAAFIGTTINPFSSIVANDLHALGTLITPKLNNGADLIVPALAGTLARMEDIPTDVDNFVDLATAQTITGVKTFINPVYAELIEPIPATGGTSIGNYGNPYTRGYFTMLNNGGDLIVPAVSGTLALKSDIPTDVDNFVDLTSVQSITGQKTFNSGINVTALNGYAIPAGGQLALASAIPTNATYVDLTSAQTITGAKVFAVAPTFSGTQITANTNTLNWPASGGTLALTSQTVDLTTNQSIAGNKTFTGLTTLNNLSRSNINYRCKVYTPTTGAGTNNDMLVGSKLGSLVFAANELQVGDIIKFEAWGMINCIAGPSCTFTLSLTNGTTTTKTTQDVSVYGTAAVSNQTWRYSGVGVVLSTGTGGTIQWQTLGEIANAATTQLVFTSPGNAQNVAQPLTVPIDTTAVQTVGFSTSWSSSNASNAVTLTHFILHCQ